MEALEDRRLLTIVFNTQYGAETLVTSSPFTVMSSPTVHLLLWGSKWGTGAGQTDPTPVINEAKAILNSTYFPALTEYGSDGLIGSVDSYVDTANAVPANFNPGKLNDANNNSLTEAQTELTTVINANNLPGPGNPASIQAAPIYVIIVDPVASSTNGGYNAAGTVSSKSVNIASVGTDANLQLFGDTFSHEMAERITDPGSGGVVLDEPSTIPTSLLNNPLLAYNNAANQLQIGDGEAEPSGQDHYSYRLGTAEVQPYWSNALSAFVVRDSNGQRFDLAPIWNTSTVNFTDTFNLTINADQKSNKNDTIVISRDAAGGTQVSLNGEIANFDPKTSSFEGTPLNSITINGGAGNDTVTVDYSNGDPIPVNGLSFNGGTGTNTIAAIGNTNFTLTNSSLVTDLGGVSIFTNVQVANLTGGASGNSFNVSAWTGSGHLDGQGGSDTVSATKNANWTISAGVLGANDGIFLTLANIEQINATGGAGSNTFTVQSAGNVSISVSGGGGSDTIWLEGASLSTIATHDSSADIVTPIFIPPFSTDTHVAFAGISRLECHSGTGSTEIDIDDLTTGPSVYCYGDSDPTVVNIGSNLIDSTGPQTYFYGGLGSDTLVVSPSASDPATALDVATQQVIHNHAGNEREFNFDAAVEQVSLVGGSGNDVFSVDNLAASNGVTVTGNGGDDVLFVGFTDFDGSEPFSDFTQGNVVFHGGAGTNSVVADDTAAVSARSYELLNNSLQATGKSGLVSYDANSFVTLLGTAFGDTFSFDGNIAANLNVSGAGGNDIFTWNAANNVISDGLRNFTTYAATLTGGAGTDTMNLNDASRGEYNYVVDPGELIGYDINGTSSGEDFLYSQMESVAVTASADDNAVTVNGTSSQITGQTTLFLGAGNDSVTVNVRDAAGNPTVLSNLGISGGTDGDNLFLVDQATTGTTWTISNPFGASTQDFAVTGGALIGAGSDVEGINVYGSPGDDTFNVNQYKAGTALGIAGGDGNDMLNIGNGNLAANITNISAFTFDGQGGFDTFNLNNASETNGWSYTNGATSIQASRNPPAAAYFVTLGQANVEHLAINAGPNADNLSLTAVASGELLAFFGNDGNDSITSVSAMTSVQGPVFFYGGGGTGNAFNSLGNADAANRTVHLDQTSLGAFPGDDFFGLGGALYFYSLQSIVITMGNGSDTVYAQPNATATVNIRGSNPTTPPGDTLNLALADAANHVVTPTSPTAGNVTSSNRPTLTYSGFETGPNVDDVAPSILAQGYDNSGVVSDIFVQFSEDVSNSLSVGSLDLVDWTTGQPVPSGLLAVTYDSGTNTAAFTFPGYPGGFLPAGDYTAKIYGTLTDLFGNPMGVETPFEFTVAPPVVLLDAPNSDYATSWNDSGAVAIANAANASITDGESASLAALTVTLASPQPGDVLVSDTTGTNITANFDGTSLVLSGPDSLANYQQVLTTITYDNTNGGPNVASETIDVVANDGTGDSNIATVTIGVGPVVLLDAPNSGYATSWNDSGVVAIANPATALITDGESASLTALTVTLASPQPGDLLAADTTGTNITANFDGTSLVLSGPDSLADYQQVLITVTYDNTVGGPGVHTETVALTAVDDQTVASNVAVATITNNQPPVIDLNGAMPGNSFNASFLINRGAVPIEDPTATLIDQDSASIVSLTVALDNPQPGDILTADTTGTNISASFSDGSLLLSGPDTAADYQQVLESIKYDNTAAGPAVALEMATFTAVDSFGNTGTASSTVSISANSTVAERFLFYSRSGYDKATTALPFTPLAFSDDNAIATDKSAYLPGPGAGSPATFANVSSYSQGINGIMVDLSAGGSHSSIAVSDFVFKAGNTATVDGTWTTLSGANLPTVSVRLGMTGSAQGAGTTSGTDRVELIWASGTAVTQKWLEVTVKAGAATGLAADDHFFFGSEIGDANKSNLATIFKVTATDTTSTQTHVSPVGSNNPITNVFDYNRDGAVGTADITLDQTHGTTNSTGLITITIPAAGPFAPAPGAAPSTSSGPAAAESALVSSSPSQSPSSVPPWIVNRLSQVDLSHGPVAAYFQHLAHENTAKSRAILTRADQVVGALGLDEDLFDSMLVKMDLG